VDMKEVSLNNNEFVGLDYSLGNRIYPSWIIGLQQFGRTHNYCHCCNGSVYEH